MAIIRTIEGESGDYSPGMHADSRGGGRIRTDPSGDTKVRGSVLTDEGGYRCNFSGTSIYISIGSCTFTNGSDVVTGSNFDSDNIHVGNYVKLDADSDSNLVQIESIVDDNNIVLAMPYTGSTATGNASTSIMSVNIGAGSSYNITNGNLLVSSGTTSGSLFTLDRDVDYNPIIKQTGISISQRSNDQVITIGLYDQTSSAFPRYWAWFKFTGTDNTFVTCESAYNRTTTPTIYETESIQVKLPNNLTTLSSNRYRIECLVDKVRFLINGVLVAENFKSIPNPYALLTSTVRILNTRAVGISTTLSVDYDSVQNFNKIVTGPINDTDPSAATTNDMETLVNLITQLISRTPIPDSLGRVRTNSEVTASTVVTATNLSSNTAQVGGQTVQVGNGIGGNGVARTSIASDCWSNGPAMYIGSNIPIIYDNILVS